MLGRAAGAAGGMARAARGAAAARAAAGRKAWYAVRSGRAPGLYASWAAAEPQVRGFPRAEFRGFRRREDAEAYLGGASGAGVARRTRGGPAESVRAAAGAGAGGRSSGEKAARPWARGRGLPGRKASEDEALRRVEGRAGGPGWWLLQFDGGSRGNPGVAGGGVLLEGPGGRPRVEAAYALGRCSNNVAEYGALARGLELAVARGARRVQVEGDSLLVVQQLSGAYRISHPDMADLSARVFATASDLEECVVRHIPRRENAVADRLANQAMDDQRDSLVEE